MKVTLNNHERERKALQSRTLIFRVFLIPGAAMQMFLIGLVFAIPIVAILADTYIKAKKLDAQSGLGRADSRQMEALQKEVRSLLDENRRLQERVHNLETIVTDVDFDVLPPPLMDERASSERAERLAKRFLKKQV